MPAPDPDRKPTRDEIRQGGRVAAVLLVLVFLFTLAFIWMA
jgi:hypothetical protein